MGDAARWVNPGFVKSAAVLGTVKATPAWPGWLRKTPPDLTAPALSGVSSEWAAMREWAPLGAEPENWV